MVKGIGFRHSFAGGNGRGQVIFLEGIVSKSSALAVLRIFIHANGKSGCRVMQECGDSPPPSVERGESSGIRVGGR